MRGVDDGDDARPAEPPRRRRARVAKRERVAHGHRHDTPLRSEDARDGVERIVHVCVRCADRKVADDGVERALRGVVGEERVERDARPRAEPTAGDRPGDARDPRGPTRGGQFAPSFLVEIHREEIARRARRLLVRLHRVHRHPGIFARAETKPSPAPEPQRQRARGSRRRGSSGGVSSGVSRPHPTRPLRARPRLRSPSQVERQRGGDGGVAPGIERDPGGLLRVALAFDVAVRSHPRSARQHAGAFGVVALFQRDVQHAETGMVGAGGGIDSVGDVA